MVVVVVGGVGEEVDADEDQDGFDESALFVEAAQSHISATCCS